jgi:hypothetical protein
MGILFLAAIGIFDKVYYFIYIYEHLYQQAKSMSLVPVAGKEATDAGESSSELQDSKGKPARVILPLKYFASSYRDWYYKIVVPYSIGQRIFWGAVLAYYLFTRFYEPLLLSGFTLVLISVYVFFFFLGVWGIVTRVAKAKAGGNEAG